MELFDFYHIYIFVVIIIKNLFCNFTNFNKPISQTKRKTLLYNYTNRFEHRDVINLHR